VKTIKQVYKIKAPVSEVWRALTDPKYITAWGGGPAEMDDKVGTDFKIWGGDIHGKNIEVVPQKKLVQDWYGGDWAEPSIVTFELTSEPDGTRITLSQKNVPDDEFTDISDGWKDYYLGPLKDYLEQKKDQD
jgi:uncharacterized protein YndB with AHSA1/START domain